MVNLRLIPEILRKAGVPFATHYGWETRGHDFTFEPVAIMFHHDASPPGDSPGALEYLLNGFKSASDTNYDAQIWVARTGTWHILATGYAQHAGAGQGFGVIPSGQGNRHSVGIETDHTTGELWPTAQLSSLRRGMAALCLAFDWDPANSVVGHKEYAPGRKDDPDGINMSTWRRDVTVLVNQLRNGDDDVSNTHDELKTAAKDALQEWATERHDKSVPGDPADTLREVLDGFPELVAKVNGIAEAVAKVEALLSTDEPVTQHFTEAQLPLDGESEREWFDAETAERTSNDDTRASEPQDTRAPHELHLPRNEG